MNTVPVGAYLAPFAILGSFIWFVAVYLAATALF